MSLQKMVFNDRVYGRSIIDNPVVLEIIASKDFQRLKGINQSGYPRPHYGISHYSRYEHCLGVYLLLKKFHTSQEEQLAGLIHDVSHSVFSHSIDYVLEAGSEKEHNHQDNIHPQFVKNSPIAKILEKYGFNVDFLLDDKNFPLKETLLPDLCADRIDYSLREARVFGQINKQRVDSYLGNLTIVAKKWVFQNETLAKDYAQLFLTLNHHYWAGLNSAIMFRTTGDCVRLALSKGYLLETDLYTTDQQVLTKIKKHLYDPDLARLWKRMNRKVGIENNPNDFDTQVFCKSRVVDPLFLVQGKIKRISEIDGDWAKILATESKPKVYFLKFRD